MSGTAFLGTSGFAYKEWKGTFYPSEIRDDGMLAYYASQMSSVEINYTFQRTAEKATIERWVSQTPVSFRFSLKAHRNITHIRRLANAHEQLETFLKSIAPLGERTAAVLFQCPPTLEADQSLLEDFLSLLPLGRFAVEFRHPTWGTDETLSALGRRGVAWCVADTDDCDASVERTAQEFVYIRLRKTTYDDESLSRWAKSIREALDDGADVYCYLKHEDEGRGIDYARGLAAFLRGGSL